MFDFEKTMIQSQAQAIIIRLNKKALQIKALAIRIGDLI